MAVEFEHQASKGGTEFKCSFCDRDEFAAPFQLVLCLARRLTDSSAAPKGRMNAWAG